MDAGSARARQGRPADGGRDPAASNLAAPLARAIAIGLVLSLGPAERAVADAFKADRDYLFRACATMPGYAQPSASSQTATPSGTWRLGPSQQEGVMTILDVWESTGDADAGRLAYILGTARRETAGSMKPIREAPKCGLDEECRERAIGKMLLSRAKDPAKVHVNYARPNAKGLRYYGRGLNQITSEARYRSTGARLGLDLVGQPDLVLDPAISATILVRGMQEGWFGSRKPLSAYIDGEQQDWLGARATTNPDSPHRAVTAGYAKDFYRCLRPSAPN